MDGHSWVYSPAFWSSDWIFLSILSSSATSTSTRKIMKVKPINHKFHAKPSYVDDKWFGSKAEAQYYTHLKLLQEQGKIVFFLRQVPFDLPGKVKYFVDFVEFWADGTVKFTDVKGYETETFKLKKKMVEEIYPVELHIVRKH